ncbi:MAG: HlyD family secretion protein [Paraglaciecola sp.]|jgi:HlyD family secretion protein
MAKKNKNKNNNKLIFILVGLIAVLIAAVMYKQKNKPQGEKVAAENAEKRTIKETVAASGKVFPITEVKISSDVSGEIVELKVAEGDSVVTGQLLAKVDPDAYESQVERGVANVNSSKAQLANTRSVINSAKAQKTQIEAQVQNQREMHQRNEKLFKEGVISDADFQNSQSSLQQLEASLASAEASIQSAQENARAAEFSVKSSQATLKETQTSLRRTIIYAPIGGVVSLLNMELGERVVGNGMMSGTEILRIANLNAMEVQVEVSENDIPRVALGQIVDVEIDAYIDRKFKGRVSQIANSANNMMSAAGTVSLTTDQVTNFVVKINIDQSSYADLISVSKPFPFRPGMSASVEIFTQTVEDVITIPIQAVTTREKDALDGKKKKGEKSKSKDEIDENDLIEVVFVMQADTAALVEVKTGVQDDEYIQISSGLTTESMVITAPYAAVSRELEQGDKVIIVDEKELYKKEDD